MSIISFFKSLYYKYFYKKVAVFTNEYGVPEEALKIKGPFYYFIEKDEEECPTIRRRNREQLNAEFGVYATNKGRRAETRKFYMLEEIENCNERELFYLAMACLLDKDPDKISPQELIDVLK